MSTPSEEKNKFLQKLYRLLSIRARSEKEIRDYLKFKKKIEDEKLVDDFINTLKNQGLIDDLGFAKSWILSRSRKKGARVIRIELLQKGISREIIEKVYSDQVTGYSEEETAEKLLEKKIKVWKNLNYLECKKKAYEFLLRRGFEYEMVKDIIEKYLKKD